MTLSELFNLSLILIKVIKRMELLNLEKKFTISEERVVISLASFQSLGLCLNIIWL